MSDLATPELTLDLTRHFAAPPERVFDAWLTPEWAQWLPPKAATCRLALHEPRVGGRFETNMTMPDGREVNTSGVYREIDRPHRLVFTWTADYAGFETLITLTFTHEDGGTRMTLRQAGFPSSETRSGYEIGWGGPGGSFDKLEALLRG